MSDAIMNFAKAYRATIKDNSDIQSRHIQAPFLKFSSFYFFHLIMADFLILLGYVQPMYPCRGGATLLEVNGLQFFGSHL